jgi:hypothetical protein
MIFSRIRIMLSPVGWGNQAVVDSTNAKRLGKVRQLDLPQTPPHATTNSQQCRCVTLVAIRKAEHAQAAALPQSASTPARQAG